MIEPSITLYLSVFGITYLLCDSYLFEAPRLFLCSKFYLFQEFFSCYFCTGFWVATCVFGVWTGWVGYDGSALVFIAHTILRGFAGASFAFVTNALVSYFQSHRR